MRYMKQPTSQTCERSRGHFRLSVYLKRVSMELIGLFGS